MASAFPLLAASALSALLLAPVAAAQDDACTQAEPCAWFLTVDGTGFVDEPPGGWNFTTGDWFVLTVLNEDDAPHTVSIAGIVSVDAPAAAVVDSAPFQWPAADRYTARDAPSGAQAAVDVLDVDVVAAQTDGDDPTGDGGGQERAPGPSMVLIAGALAGGVLLAAGRGRE